MARTSISPRWQAYLLAAFVIACVTFLAFRFWPRDNPQNLLGRLPQGSAIQLYVDVPAAVKASEGGGLPTAWSLGLAAGRFEALALGLSEHELYVVSAGRFSGGIVEAALRSQGVECPAPVAAAPCTATLEHGPVSIRLIDDRTLFVTTAVGAVPPSHSVSTDQVKQALDRGAVAWAAIDPSQLDRAMENPPAHWINLQLIARALEPASKAYFALTPATEGTFTLELEAHGAGDEAEELQRVLEGLNDMAISLAARDPEASRQWSSVLDSFESAQAEEIVRAQWLLQAEHVARLWLAN